MANLSIPKVRCVRDPSAWAVYAETRRALNTNFNDSVICYEGTRTFQGTVDKSR